VLPHCAEPELQPLTQAIKYIVLSIVVLAMVALAVALVAGSGGTAAPALASIMAAVGLSALTFPATAGELCNPIPLGRHLGGNSVHNQCADTRIGNKYPGSDVCVSDGVEYKNFDAFSGSILWEVKTYNFDKGNAGKFLVPMDQPEWQKESRIARGCGFSYWYTVGDTRHPAAIEAVQSNFVPVIADNLEIDPTNCLQP